MAIIVFFLALGAVLANASTSVVEHAVLFKMPALLQEQELEQAVLRNLNSLGTFPGVYTLLAGRLFKEVEGYTHGLFARFPDEETLTSYYNSQQFLDAIQPMLPVLQGEATVDYPALVTTNTPKRFPREVVHMVFFSLNGTFSQAEEEIQKAVHWIKIFQLSDGLNNQDRDTTFTHGLVARLPPANVFLFKRIVERVLSGQSTRLLQATVKPSWY